MEDILTKTLYIYDDVNDVGLYIYIIMSQRTIHAASSLVTDHAIQTQVNTRLESKQESFAI